MTPLSSERNSLLAAIRANPDDDTPRLVYADWLQENDGAGECQYCMGVGVSATPHRKLMDVGSWFEECPRCDGSGTVENGFAARAEFIRAQCELVKLPPCDAGLNKGRPGDDEAKPACRCRWHELRRLTIKIKFNVDIPVLSAPGGLRRWRRGFITFAWMGWPDWVTHHKTILNNPDVILEEVRLMSWPSSDLLGDLLASRSTDRESIENALGEAFKPRNAGRRIKFKLP